MAAKTFTEKQIAQNRPAVTTTSALFTASGARYIITAVHMSVNGGAACNGSLYHDDDGTTYSATTRVMSNLAIPAGGCVITPCYIALADGGSIGCQSNVASGINFTLYGVEIT